MRLWSPTDQPANCAGGQPSHSAEVILSSPTTPKRRDELEPDVGVVTSEEDSLHGRWCRHRPAFHLHNRVALVAGHPDVRGRGVGGSTRAGALVRARGNCLRRLLVRLGGLAARVRSDLCVAVAQAGGPASRRLVFSGASPAASWRRMHPAWRSGPLSVAGLAGIRRHLLDRSGQVRSEAGRGSTSWCVRRSLRGVLTKRAALDPTFIGTTIDGGLTSKWSRRAACLVPSCRKGARLIYDVMQPGAG